MGCAASKAPPKRDPVEELIEEEELPALDLPEFTTLNAGGNPREAAWKS